MKSRSAAPLWLRVRESAPPKTPHPTRHLRTASCRATAGKKLQQLSQLVTGPGCGGTLRACVAAWVESGSQGSKRQGWAAYGQRRGQGFQVRAHETATVWKRWAEWEDIFTLTASKRREARERTGCASTLMLPRRTGTTRNLVCCVLAYVSGESSHSKLGVNITWLWAHVLCAL